MKSEDRFFLSSPKRAAQILGFALLPLLALATGHAQEETEEVTSELLDRIELRSVVSLPGEVLFSLHDPEAETTFWIEIDQTRNGIEAVAFDEESNTLTLRHGEAVREVGLSNRGAIGSAVEDDDGERSREERREAWRQRREQRQQEWAEFRERWEAAVEEDPQLQEVEAHREELQGEWRNLREQMRDVDRDSDEFDAIREQARQLREEQQALEEYGVEAARNSSALSEEDVERVEDMLEGPRGRRGRGRGRN